MKFTHNCWNYLWNCTLRSFNLQLMFFSDFSMVVFILFKSIVDRSCWSNIDGVDSFFLELQWL